MKACTLAADGGHDKAEGDSDRGGGRNGDSDQGHEMALVEAMGVTASGCGTAESRGAAGSDRPACRQRAGGGYVTVVTAGGDRPACR